MDFTPPCNIFSEAPEVDIFDIENFEPPVQKVVKTGSVAAPPRPLVPLDKYSGTPGRNTEAPKEGKRKEDRSMNKKPITFFHITFELGHLIPKLPPTKMAFYC